MKAEPSAAFIEGEARLERGFPAAFGQAPHGADFVRARMRDLARSSVFFGERG